MPPQTPDIPFITSNPALDTYQRGQKLAQEEQTADIQNRKNLQDIESSKFNLQQAQAEGPTRLRMMSAQADAATANASTAQTDAQYRKQQLEAQIAASRAQVAASSTQVVLGKINARTQIFSALDNNNVPMAKSIAALARVPLPDQVIADANERNALKYIHDEGGKQYPNPQDAKKRQQWEIGAFHEYKLQQIDAQAKGQTVNPQLAPYAEVPGAPEPTPTKSELMTVSPGATVFDPSTGKSVFQNTSTTFDDSTLTMLAQRAYAGDTGAFQNLGRGAQGAENLGALNKKIQEIGRARGLDDQQIAQTLVFAKQQMAGGTAYQRTAGAMGARVETAGNEVQQALPLALEASRNLPRGWFVPWNQLMQQWQQGTSDPAYNDFVLKNFALINAYTRSMNPQGIPRITERLEQKANGILSTATSPEAYEVQARALWQETQRSRAAVAQTRGGGGPSAGQIDTNAPMPGAIPSAPGPGGGAAPGGAQPPPGAPRNAKQAPDGNWYVPDPNRPGKYLQYVP